MFVKHIIFRFIFSANPLRQMLNEILDSILSYEYPHLTRDFFNAYSATENH